MSKTHPKKTSFLTSIFLDFWLPTWANIRKSNPKIEVFFGILGQLGPTWANLGQKDVPRGSKRAKLRRTSLPREPTWGQTTSQESQNQAKSPPKRTQMISKGPICLQDPPGALTWLLQDPPGALTRPSQARYQWKPLFLGQKGEASKAESNWPQRG